MFLQEALYLESIVWSYKEALSTPDFIVPGGCAAWNRGADYVEHLAPALAPESGKGGFFSRPPHNTLHAGPHRAFHQGHRAEAG
jgi:hypothetical protein